MEFQTRWKHPPGLQLDLSIRRRTQTQLEQPLPQYLLVVTTDQSFSLSHRGSIARKVAGAPDTPIRGSEARIDDPLGLKVIHRPTRERRIDIIFIHGLGGSSRMSWSKNRDPSLFWPLQFLPYEPDINEARILTFGYNANFKPGSGKAKVSILDFAKDLLYDLKYAQDDSTARIEDLRMGEASSFHTQGKLSLCIYSLY